MGSCGLEARGDRGEVEAALRVLGRHQDAQASGDHDLAGRSGLELAPHDGGPFDRVEHLDARAPHHLGHTAARGHARTTPGRPVDGQGAGLGP